MSKKQKILDLIKSKVKHKDPNAEIILFGSRARNEEKKTSDWDILILTRDIDRNLEKDYRKEIFEIELETGESISTFVFSKSDWNEIYSVTPLFKNIQKEGVLL